ncbi:hypothetical protein B0H12DRAFT_1229251, partial [Mycena haematopus]
MSFNLSPASAQSEFASMNKEISSSYIDSLLVKNHLTSPTLVERTPSLDDFEQLLLIGRGATCSVYLVRQKATGCLYAMKQMAKFDQPADAEQEQRILKAIATLSDAPRSLLSLEASWTDAEYFYLVTPWHEGKDLSTMLANGHKFTEDR